MQCFKCGEDQAEGNIFCTKCGARLAGSHASARSPEEEEPAPVSVSPSAHEEEQKILRELKEALKGVDGEKETPATSSALFAGIKKKVWLLGIFVVILAFLGMSLLLILKDRRAGETVPAPSQPSESKEISAPSPSPPTVLVDEATRVTTGKMAAILEGVSNFAKGRKNLPSTLNAINRSYSDPGIIQDGWGQNFLYLVDLANKTFVLSSAGPDGKRGTPDDLAVMSEEAENWLKQNEAVIAEWKSVNPNLYAQLATAGMTQEESKKLELARKQEQEKKQLNEAKSQARAQAEAEQERKRLEALRLEDERKQAEARKHEEEQRLAKAREEALRQQAARKPELVKDDFSSGLGQWNAPSTWEIVEEKDLPALRVQGLGFLKKGEKWDNYRVEFDIKINKESAGWVVRSPNSNSFYLFKLSSEKAKAVPKNSLIRYIRSDDKYLNSLKREDAPGAAGVIPLSIKIKNKEYYRITVVLRGNTITHSIDGTQIDSWSDDTFDHGRFGFNASVIELATIRDFQLEPLR